MSKEVLVETGLRQINALAKRYPKAKIYFHQDLDGVATAIAMKKYLENNGIEVVDAEIIQYGDREFAVKKLDARGDVMPVLVDFAHGKPMFVIHTDHHDRQAGAEETKSKQFRGARSNVETISQIVSPVELFPDKDILIISTVDSANYANFDISPEEVMNYLYKIDKEKSVLQNKFMVGLALNKILLAHKNQKGFMESIVMNSNPSLTSILTNVIKFVIAKKLPTRREMQKNQEKYVETMKSAPNVTVVDGIVIQYGMGKWAGPGSYDRYVPFRNNPDADFLVIAWPLGLLQASCNPFKKDRELKGVNLGDIAQEVLSKYESQLKEKIVPLSTIKWISETSVDEESVGFTAKDFRALYKKNTQGEDGQKLETIMEKPFTSLTDDEMRILDEIGVSAWDIIQSNSGGHKCITNISGLNYLGRSKRPPEGKYRPKGDPSDDTPYIKFLKMLQRDFVEALKKKIKESKLEEDY